MLELKNLCFSVTDDNNAEKEIINNISLTIEDNKFIAITGPNGGGKSTLAKLIAGIYRPTSGQIIFDGPVASLKRFKDDVKEVKSGYECGIVFEKFNEIREGDQIEAYAMVEVPR